MDTTLYRFRLEQLIDTAEEEAQQYLQSAFKLDEQKCQRFMSGKFVFKPAKSAVVDRSISLLRDKGLVCSKHTFEIAKKIKANAEKAKQAAQQQPSLQSNEVGLDLQQENLRLKTELSVAQEQIKTLEERLSHTPVFGEAPAEEPEEDTALTAEDLLGSEPAEAKQLSFSDNPQSDKADSSTEEKATRKIALTPTSLAAGIGAIALLMVTTTVSFLNQAETATVQVSSEDIALDYQGLAARNKISLSAAKRVAERLGSVEKVMQYELEAKRLSMPLLEYVDFKPYADSCKNSRRNCKNAQDFVDINLGGTLVMNHYKDNCDQYTLQKYSNIDRGQRQIFTSYNPQDTKFKTDNQFILTGKVRSQNNAGQWSSQDAWCTVDVNSGRIREVSFF